MSIYDGLGRREKKTIGGNLTEFLFDGVNPVQETSGATVLANILTGLGIDEYFTRTDVPAAATSQFLPDALGSTIALTDGAGAVQTEYTYEPFGRTSVTGAPNTSPFQYTGRENDGTGLYYYRARYYQPQLQRFASEDPIEFRGEDTNLYAYVWNNPLLFADPYGLIPLCGKDTVKCPPPPPPSPPKTSKSSPDPRPKCPPGVRCPPPAPPPCKTCTSFPCTRHPYICYGDGSWGSQQPPDPFAPNPEDIQD